MVTQRDKMRQIWATNRNRDFEAVISAYAQAERDGEVARKRGTDRVDPEAYARALLKDGIKKGWLE